MAYRMLTRVFPAEIQLGTPDTVHFGQILGVIVYVCNVLLGLGCGQYASHRWPL